MKFSRIKTDGSPRNIIRLPRLGKIRLGIKKISAKTKKEYPAEVDYFVCPKEVREKFGEQPKALPVMIPVENEEMVYRQYYACYGSNQKLKCQGDGQDADRRTEQGIEHITCPSPDNCDYAAANGCRARIDIMFVLPDINMGGVYQISTGSVNSDIDIRSGIEMAKYLFGRISWVPMQIVREARKTPNPKTGAMEMHWPVRLYPIATVSETNQIRQDTTRILERQAQFALPEPEIEGELDTPTELISESEKEEEEGPNYKFLKAMKAEKERVGDAIYYGVLKDFKVEHSNQITKREDQIKIYDVLKILHKREEANAG